MKPTKIFIILAIAVLFTNACSKREFIVAGDKDLISFKFFLFADMNGEKFQANGDAVVKKDMLFKFRLYDNLLNKHVLSFKSAFDGKNIAIFPMDKLILESKDDILSEIMTKYMYMLFIDVNEAEFKNNSKIKGYILDKNKIQLIIIEYYNYGFQIEVLRRFDDGKTRRIKISNGETSLIFDIVEYKMLDFEMETDTNYTYIRDEQERSFFDLIGVAYGQ